MRARTIEQRQSACALGRGPETLTPGFIIELFCKLLFFKFMRRVPTPGVMAPPRAIVQDFLPRGNVCKAWSSDPERT